MELELTRAAACTYPHRLNIANTFYTPNDAEVTLVPN